MVHTNTQTNRGYLRCIEILSDLIIYRAVAMRGGSAYYLGGLGEDYSRSREDYKRT